ncbi:formimidoylglutamase [Pedobacter sp. MW01-1-1]|uniref:formimidoylglutamase n=1 Tax=Pedobacter sp. MW01-1-1 TaxID=3383027 RepID=UPI003FEEB2D7
MDGFKLYSQGDINRRIIPRDGEQKLGECVQVLANWEQLATSKATFVLLGIPEDIGVRANNGMAGAASAWQTSLTAILNTQSTRFLKGNELLVLGSFEIDEPKDLSLEGLRAKVKAIDNLVYPIIQKIVQAGKVPIVIGGGHNNAFPIIKGTVLAKEQPIDVLNIDAHADLRSLEGRHSGNGFSQAIHDGYLDGYLMYGLHQNYNNETILSHIESSPKLSAVFFEDILVGKEDKNAFNKLKSEIGLELDLDCIQNVLSSAETPSGFAVNDIRKLILTLNKKISYFHVCEGAVRMLDGRVSKFTAKLIAYLVTDFIKANKL